jgi:predicted  nucleic acid-binding Zn-ribbon protein
VQTLETDFTVHSDETLKESIEQLTLQERHISTVRTRVHERIEFIRSGGAGFGETIDEQLDQLEEEEKTVSRQRREIHLVLDAALAEQHLRRVAKHADFLDEDPPPPFRNRDRVQVSDPRRHR